MIRTKSDYRGLNIVDASDCQANRGDHARYVQVGGDFGTLGTSYGEDDNAVMGSFPNLAAALSRGFTKKVPVKAPSVKVSADKKVVTVPVVSNRPKTLAETMAAKKWGSSPNAFGQRTAVAAQAAAQAKKVEAAHPMFDTKSVSSWEHVDDLDSMDPYDIEVKSIPVSSEIKINTPPTMNKRAVQVRAAQEFKKSEQLRKVTGANTSNSVALVRPHKMVKRHMEPDSMDPYDIECETAHVVSNGGQLSESKINSPATSVAVAHAASVAAFTHPLLFAPISGGVDGMGAFSFTSLMTDIKAKAAAEAEKLKANLLASAQAAAGKALSNVSGSILAKPEVQSALSAQAKQAAASSVAEKLLDPANQKKIMIAVGVIGAVGLALAAAAMRRR